MKKAIFLRKHFLETSKHYEKRINEAIVAASSSGELTQILFENKNLVIYYIEKQEVKSQVKVLGFGK